MKFFERQPPPFEELLQLTLTTAFSAFIATYGVGRSKSNPERIAVGAPSREPGYIPKSELGKTSIRLSFSEKEKR